MTNEELEAKVIRCYKKGVTTNQMGTLGICNPKKANKILSRNNITKMRGFKDYDLNPSEHKDNPTPFSDSFKS